MNEREDVWIGADGWLQMDRWMDRQTEIQISGK